MVVAVVVLAAVEGQECLLPVFADVAHLAVRRRQRLLSPGDGRGHQGLGVGLGPRQHLAGVGVPLDVVGRHLVGQDDVDFAPVGLRGRRRARAGSRRRFLFH